MRQSKDWIVRSTAKAVRTNDAHVHWSHRFGLPHPLRNPCPPPSLPLRKHKKSGKWQQEKQSWRKRSSSSTGERSERRQVDLCHRGFYDTVGRIFLNSPDVSLWARLNSFPMDATVVSIQYWTFSLYPDPVSVSNGYLGYKSRERHNDDGDTPTMLLSKELKFLQRPTGPENVWRQTTFLMLSRNGVLGHNLIKIQPRRDRFLGLRPRATQAGLRASLICCSCGKPRRTSNTRICTARHAYPMSGSVWECLFRRRRTSRFALAWKRYQLPTSDADNGKNLIDYPLSLVEE